MPAVSQAQARLMYATANGADTGVPKKVAKEYIEATPSVKDLPPKKKRFAKLMD